MESPTECAWNFLEHCLLATLGHLSALGLGPRTICTQLVQSSILEASCGHVLTERIRGDTETKSNNLTDDAPAKAALDKGPFGSMDRSNSILTIVTSQTLKTQTSLFSECEKPFFIHNRDVYFSVNELNLWHPMQC